MKSFKKEYRQAMDAIQTPQFDPEKMKNAEKRYKKAVEQTALDQAASSYDEDAMIETLSEQAAEYDGDDPEIMDGADMEISTVQYNSRKDLLASGITCSLPDRYLFGEITRERYYVVGDDYLMVDIESGDKTFYMDQSYFGNSSGHATSTVYGEKLTNKRNYVTKDGYLYVVADTPGEEDSPNGIHAAISVGDYELIVDFYGYSEKEAFEVLDHLDLSVYQ